MAMQNLIDNAINYSPENTKVAVTSRVKEGIVEISVHQIMIEITSVG
jgi:two-component system sensor histidine kinase SenX3